MKFTDRDNYWLQYALQLAEMAAANGEVPVGAVLVLDDNLVGEGWNCPIGTSDPTAHAEIIALRNAASRLNNYRLLNSTLYVTLEPCAMCAGAIVYSRVKRVCFGAYDPRAGAAGSVFNVFAAPELNHRVEYQGGLMHLECANILKKFFQTRR